MHVQTSIACSHLGDARFKHSWVLGTFGWKITWLRSTSHCSQVPSPDLTENNGKTPGEQSRSELANCLSFFSLRKLLFLLLYLTWLSKLCVFSHPDLTWMMSDREEGRQIQKYGKWQSWIQHIQEINIISRYSAKAGYSSWGKMGNVKLSWQRHTDSSSWKRHIPAHTIVSSNWCLSWENTDVCNFFDFFLCCSNENNLVALKNSSRTWYCKCYFCTNCKLLIQTKHTITYRTVLKCILIIKMYLKIDWS